MNFILTKKCILLRSASFSFNFIISLSFQCNLATSHLLDKQRLLLFMGVFTEFRSLGAFLLDFLEDEVLKEVIVVSSLSLIF